MEEVSLKVVQTVEDCTLNNSSAVCLSAYVGGTIPPQTVLLLLGSTGLDGQSAINDEPIRSSQLGLLTTSSLLPTAYCYVLGTVLSTLTTQCAHRSPDDLPLQTLLGGKMSKEQLKMPKQRRR